MKAFLLVVYKLHRGSKSSEDARSLLNLYSIKGFSKKCQVYFRFMA